MASTIVFEGVVELQAAIGLVGAKVDKGVAGIMQRGAQVTQDYARLTAPWTDQTGNARQGLFAQYAKTGVEHSITLYHTMPYGIWLEVKQAGKYAVIMPTIDVQARAVFAQISELIGILGAL